MLRWTLLRAADSDRLAELARGSEAVGRVVERYIAGETIEQGISAATALAAEGMDLTLDHVGEFVDSAEHAQLAADVYRQVLAHVQARSLPAGVSVKPTQLGLLIDHEGCVKLITDLAEHAAAAGVHLTLDMEDHTVAETTVRLVEQVRAAGSTNVGCALQSYLHRTPDDVRRLTRLGVSIRLCKGAYAEPAHLAYQRPVEVARAYLDDARHLLHEGTEPRFATHDHRLIAAIKREAAIIGRPRESYEFQMLYGVRPQMQRALVADGYRLRIYLPFGTQWYPYFTRRIAERPANLLFFLRSLTALGSRDRAARPGPTASGPSW